MRRALLTVALLIAVLALLPATASADDLTCIKARNLAMHPNAYCNKTSDNHVWLYFPWHECQEHVYWWHPVVGVNQHYYVVNHCGTWSHPT